ncbi:MAG: hypothetical protein ABJA79_09535 [Parafilimonas sp.]
MPNFTPEDLLLYLYNELNTHKAATVEEELHHLWTLHEKFNILKEAKTRIEKMPLQSPRRQTLKAIMEYVHNPTEISKS